MRKAVEKHRFVFEGTPIPVTISVGIAGLPDPAVKDAADLIARADKALYQSKHGGRNRVTIHQRSLQPERVRAALSGFGQPAERVRAALSGFAATLTSATWSGSGFQRLAGERR